MSTVSQDQQAIGGAYEGASRLSQELALWSPSRKSADGDILPDKLMLDARVRDIIRNDGYSINGLNTYKDSIVGGQYNITVKPNIEILSKFDKRFDDKWAEEFQIERESSFTLWAESLSNWPDAARVNNLTELVRLGIGIFVFAGEFLATVEWIKDGSPANNTAIQVVDLDRLSNPYGVVDSPKMRRGIERNFYGAPIAYHIRNGHPSDLMNPDSYKWKRVEARKPWGRHQVIHLFEQGRPDQSRGVSGVVSVLKEMKMAKKYSDVALQNAVLNATYAATIESELPADAVYSQLGQGFSTTAIEAYMAQIANYVGASKNIHIDGVKIPHLYPGTKLNLHSPNSPGGVGEAFEDSLTRKIAAGWGISHEEFVRNFTKSNYSNTRAAMSQTYKRMMAVKKIVADRIATMIYSLHFEEDLNKGRIILPKGIDPSFFYQGHNKEAVCACSWVGASRGQIDELKETEAAVLRIEKGLSTYEHEAALLGRDFRDLFRQRAREKKLMASLGLDDTSNNQTKSNSSNNNRGSNVDETQ